MRKSHLSWLLVIFIVVSVVCISIPALYRTSTQSENFPLERVWVTHLNGTVVAMSVANNDIVLVRTSKSLYAIAAETGKVLWHFNLSWQAEPEPAVICNGIIYVADGKGLWVLNHSDGSILWSQKDIGPNPRVTDVSGEYVVVEESETFYVYDALQGSLLLERPMRCRGIKTAYLDSSRIYFGCQGVEIIDITSGEILSDGNRQGIVGYTDAIDGTIYYSPDEPVIEAFDTRTQTRLWRVPQQIDGFERFRVIGDILYFTDFSKICALQRMDGQLLWCTEVFYPQNPTLLENILYVFNGNSTVITALNPENGDIIGSLTLKNLNHFSTFRELMASSEDLLFFASGREVFAFGE